jgi:UDP-2,4-diacetamido-2,4,6-trideoxy-beta-L-altropyranose hydrolase
LRMHRRAVFRVDASLEVGSGHVMRCLTLADDLNEQGFESMFICRILEGHMADYIKRRGFDVCLMPTEKPLNRADTRWDADFAKKTIDGFVIPPEWLIVDHYGIDAEWESIVLSSVGQILVIDDLANRSHVCDIMLNQNVCDTPEFLYKGLVPANCRCLVGSNYLLLRPSFYEARRQLAQRNGVIERLLVFFGGSDPTDETSKAVEALQSINRSHTLFQVDVVIGQANYRRGEIEQKCAILPYINLHIQVENMAELVGKSDFALGSGGVAMWERCYLGLPSAVTVVADNQSESVQIAERFGAIWKLGWHEQINAGLYADILHKALNSPKELALMSSKALELLDSRAETAENRVLKALLEEQ